MSFQADLCEPTLSLIVNALHPIKIEDGADATQKSGQRRAAVLVPLILRKSGWQVLLTQRPDTMPNHAGQISFPGGRTQEGERALSAALRETHEEVGIPAHGVQPLGRLASFNAISGFRVTPFVGVVDPSAKIIPCEREVADAFEIPLEHFMNPENHVRRIFERDGHKMTLWDMPYTDPSGTYRNVWGMTAMMLYRLYQRAYVRDFSHPDIF